MNLIQDCSSCAATQSAYCAPQRIQYADLEVEPRGTRKAVIFRSLDEVGDLFRLHITSFAVSAMTARHACMRGAASLGGPPAFPPASQLFLGSYFDVAAHSSRNTTP